MVLVPQRGHHWPRTQLHECLFKLNKVEGEIQTNQHQGGPGTPISVAGAAQRSQSVVSDTHMRDKNQRTEQPREVKPTLNRDAMNLGAQIRHHVRVWYLGRSKNSVVFQKDGKTARNIRILKVTTRTK